MALDKTRGKAASDRSSLADKEASLDPMRKMILAGMRRRNLTFADLSREVGGNAAYIHQFIYRGTPKFLPEGRRDKIAALLEIDETELMPGGAQHAGNRRAPETIQTVPARLTARDPRASRSARPQMTIVPQNRKDREVPVFAEGDELDVAFAGNWAPGAGQSSMGEASFAVWVRAPRGRLAPGDLAYIVTNRPPREGDSVVVVEDGKLRTIGDLNSITETEAKIWYGAINAQTYDLTSCKIYKVAGVQFA